MKRIFALVLIGVCLLAFAGCGKKEEPPKAYFTAEVLEVNSTNILAIVTDKGNSGASVGSDVYVTKNVTSEDGCPMIYVGDTVRIYFGGEVMETYPLQLGEVFSIEKIQNAPTPDWGVTLTAENTTPKGLTIVCEQSGGAPAGELMTGSYYIIEKYENSQWNTLDYLDMGDAEVAWTAEAWLIPMNDTVRWDVDWSWLYGELPAGQYRIGKEIMDFKGTGNYDKAIFYAEFTVE